MAGDDVDDVILVYVLDGRLSGLPARSVRQVVLAVDVTPLPGAPENILGMIDCRGEIMPVIDMRAKCGFPRRTTIPEDRFIILETRKRPLVLRVDEIRDVIAIPVAEIQPPRDIAGPLPGLTGIARRPEGLVALYDPDIMLSRECDMIAGR